MIISNNVLKLSNLILNLLPVCSGEASVGPGVGPTVGPAVGPAVGPSVGASVGPSVGAGSPS